MDLVPADASTIEQESLVVLRELMQQDDAFAGRNHSRLKRLRKSYAKWNAQGAHAAQIESIRKALLPTCSELEREASDGSESLNGRCTEFFRALGSSETS